MAVKNVRPGEDVTSSTEQSKREYSCRSEKGPRGVHGSVQDESILEMRHPDWPLPARYILIGQSSGILSLFCSSSAVAS
ncbi:hypothetical protein Zmor_002631 [Zophobas morio]|uniref:Uncharacterized protein n=1 Tax=Zophobas morio TaxID=2755281 RepID=A0AA38HL68_9CUCU|nr:hypothetical protein Zmor_002631 [Zophobas morio]